MRILLLNDDFPPRGMGGGASVVSELARGYAGAGHDVTVITTHQDSALIERRDLDGMIVISLPITYRSSLRWYLSIWNPKVSILLKQTLKTLHPFDLVHMHNIHQYLTYGSIKLVRKKSKHIIMTFHDVMSVSCARLTTKRYVGSSPHEFNYRITMFDRMKQCGWTWNPFRNMLIRMTLTHVDKKICVSQALKNLLETNGIEIDAVIHNGIDLEAIRISSSMQEEMKNRLQLQNKKVIFFGGRLSPDKGFKEVMKSFETLKSAYPDVVIAVVGDAQRAQKMIGTMEQSRLIVTGWLSRPELLTLMSLSHLIVTPSVCFDSFPTVNLEAMALAKPVIATQFGGSSELVIDRETGFIVDPRDTPQFAERMKRLLDDPALVERMGKAGQGRVAVSFTLKKQIDAYLSLIKATDLAH